MKTMVCLSGHLRQYKECYPYLKRNIIDPLNANVFISTWDTIGYWKQLTSEELNNKKVDIKENGFDSSEKINEEEIANLYKNLIRLHIYNFEEKNSYFTQMSERFEKYIKEDKWYYRIKNFISMYWLANKLLHDANHFNSMFDDEYDLVIRTRPDLQFNSPLSFLDNYDKNYLYICDNYAESGTLGDIFFAGTMENVLKYHSILYNMNELLEKTKTFNSHTLVREQLEYKNIPYKVVHLDVSLNNSKNKYCEQGRF